MLALKLLILVSLPLDAAVPGAAPRGEPLSISIREKPDGRDSTVEVVHRNLTKKPLTVHPRWGCGAVRYDELFFDGGRVVPDAEPEVCDDNYLVTIVLPPGAEFTTLFHPPFFPGEHTLRAVFTVVDDNGKVLRRIESPTLKVNHWW
jgi:hypothetical protein